MKLLTGLNDKVVPIDEADATEMLPTFRRLYRLALGNQAAKTPDEAIDLYQVGLKLKIGDNSVALEDAEFKLLKEAVGKNSINLSSHLLGQVALRLREDENRKG